MQDVTIWENWYMESLYYFLQLHAKQQQSQNKMFNFKYIYIYDNI